MELNTQLCQFIYFCQGMRKKYRDYFNETNESAQISSTRPEMNAPEPPLKPQPERKTPELTVSLDVAKEPPKVTKKTEFHRVEIKYDDGSTRISEVQIGETDHIE